MTYNYEETTELLQRAVAEKGDGYVYDADGAMCRYAEEETGAPSCIVGHVLDYVGLLDQAEEGAGALGVDGVKMNFTNRAGHMLWAAQIMHDHGRTWGEALVAAKEVGASDDPYATVTRFADEVVAEVKAKKLS
jgi:hypothetical protein